MTKIVSLRVEFAADDAVTLREVRPLLTAILAERGSEDVPMADGDPARIHWATANVLQGPETLGKPLRPRRTRPFRAPIPLAEAGE